MDDELTRSYRRWLAADENDKDDEADTDCRAVFEAALPTEPVPLAFTGRTMAALASEQARLVERKRRVRWGGTIAGVAGALAAAYLGTGLVFSTVANVLMGLFNLIIAAIVRTAAGMQAGADVWTVLGAIGTATSSFVSDPTVTFTLLVLQAIAIAALVALQRLLGSDRESFK